MKETNQLRNLMEAVDSPYDDAARMQDRVDAETNGEAEQVLGSDHTTYDIDFDNEDVTIFTLGGEPVAEMSIEAWEALIQKYNQIQRGRQGPQ